MKPREDKLRSLLDDVLPSSAAQCGPDESFILAMARREGSRRRRTRFAMTAVAAVASITFLSVRPRPAATPPAAINAPGPAPLVVHPIDDEQLFVLLQSTPTAIMEWPNGDRALLVVTAGDY